MFELKTSPCRFAAYIKILNVIVDEATFAFTPEHLSFINMCPSRVSMFHLELPASTFAEYRCDKPTNITINLAELAKLLKSGDKTETLKLTLDYSAPAKWPDLVVTFEGDVMRQFTMPTLEPEEIEKTPKIHYDVKATTKIKYLLKMLQDIALVSDHVRVSATPENITFSQKGDLMSALEIIDKTKLTDFKCAVGSAKAVFSVSYLIGVFEELIKEFEEVTLEFSTDMPIKISVVLNQPGFLLFYLAPRIECDER